MPRRPAHPLARRLGGALCLAGTLAAAASCRASAGAPAPEAAPAPAPVAVLALARPARAIRIAHRGAVPLGGHAVTARAGDWLLESAESALVVSSDHGRVIDYGARGGEDGLVYLEPFAYAALGGLDAEPPTIEPAGDGRNVLFVRARLLGPPLELRAWVYFAPAAADGAAEGGATEVLKVTSELRLVRSEPALGVALGEVVAWGNTPSWVEGAGSATRGGLFSTAFLGRENRGVAYGFCSDSGRLLARYGWPGLPGLWRAARTGESFVAVTPSSPIPTRTVSLSYSTRSLGDALLALPCVERPTRRFALPADVGRARVVEVARCKPERVLAAAESDPPGVPPELAPALAPGDPVRTDELVPYVQYPVARHDLPLPDGCFRVRLAAPGLAPGPWLPPQALAAHADPRPKGGLLRWRFDDGHGAVAPAKLVVHGLDRTDDPDWGDDPEQGASRNMIDTVAPGERALPPGRYRVGVHHGLEHADHVEDVTVADGAAVEIAASLPRVVDTSGWLSADLHVHALPSFDAPTPLDDRVRSLAAVGVEVAVATDHNAVTDYAPVIDRLGMHEHLASIVGDEVTTEEALFGHFNVFPLPPGTPPLPWERVLPSDLFHMARLVAGDASVVQVNHPRMGDIGYFDLLRMDRDDVATWLGRSPLADLSFDAIEVWNGDHYGAIGEVEYVLEDWYALLNAGLRKVATGNSDSHKIAYHEAGFPRNWVAVAADDPGHFDLRAFLTGLRAGRVVVSSGPFIDLRAGGKGLGETVPPGDVAVEVRVDAPAWLDLTLVELVVRGRTVHSWKVPPPSGDPHPRFVGRAVLPLVRGDWIVAKARGERANPHLYRRGAAPFGFTNPIWVGP
ncbi:MAG: CehA/McbA family metallohydrolase [Myxococcales bacterium]|nr:CehA/McbA family metallohydrolase [Myxococcales bacterium]